MHLNNFVTLISRIPKEPRILTRGEARISRHINDELGNGKEFILGKRTLNWINNFSVLNNSESNNYDNSHFGRLGRRLVEVFIRKHLIYEYSNKNTFFLSLYDKGLRAHNSKTLQEAFNFQKLVKVNQKDSFRDENLSNRFFNLFSIIYSTMSVDNVEKILTPLVKKGIKSDNIDFLMGLLHGYYKDKLNKKFVINIVKEDDGKFTAICKVKDKIIDKVKDANPTEARRILLKKMLSELNLYSARNSSRPLNKNLFDLDEVTPLVERMLNDIGFLDEETKKLRKYHIANDIIFRAFNPEIKVNNTITFQKLEFYGDAVANMLVERFLLEKKVSINDKSKLYAHLKSNNMFANFFDKLDLKTYLYYKDIENNPKIKADTFEALIGALHLSYSESAVYKFFKGLLEDAYNEYKR